MSLNRFVTAASFALVIAGVSIAVPAGAQVKPGDVITPDNASKVEGLVSPGKLHARQARNDHEDSPDRLP